MALRCRWYHVWFHVSYIVNGLHGVWCSFQVMLQNFIAADCVNCYPSDSNSYSTGARDLWQ